MLYYTIPLYHITMLYGTRLYYIRILYSNILYYTAAYDIAIYCLVLRSIMVFYVSSTIKYYTLCCLYSNVYLLKICNICITHCLSRPLAHECIPR